MSTRNTIRAWTPPVAISFAKRVRCVLQVISGAKYYEAKSYYPEAEKKSYLHILRELIATAWKWQGGSVKETYFAFGLDCRDRDLRDYVFVNELARIKDALNSYSYDYDNILNNKIITNILLRSWNLPVPVLLGRIEKQDGLLYFVFNDHVCLLNDYIRKNDIRCFCKPLTGYQGRGAFQLETREGCIFVDSLLISWEDLENRVTPPMTLEEVVCQHESLSALHPQSVNTIRIMTVKVNENEVHILGAIQRIGCGEKRVDNYGMGGIAVPISQEGFLTSVGYRKPGFGFRMNAHPDTQIAFNGYRIPFFRESLELAKQSHYHIGGIHSVGWDIAITPQGPIIIEANGDWDVHFAQVFHGLRKEFETLFVSRYNELNISGR